MKLKPSKIRITAKDQDGSVRVEAIDLLKKGEGRKVFSFNIYEATLDEVMKLLVLSFESATGETFSDDIREELGMGKGVTYVKRRRRSGERAAMFAQLKLLIAEGKKVGVAGLEVPDGYLEVLKNKKYEVVAEPMTTEQYGEIKHNGYMFYRKDL